MDNLKFSLYNYLNQLTNQFLRKDVNNETTKKAHCSIAIWTSFDDNSLRRQKLGCKN